MSVIRKLIRANGTEEDLVGPHAMRDIKQMIGAESLDTVSLRHLGQPLHVMLVDDLGYDKGLSANSKATELYWANCHPGTTHQIRGDVVIVPDSDFGRM